MGAIRVRPVSALWSLDRELDYLTDSGSSVSFGQRVLVPLGGQKNPELAVVTQVMSQSDFAKKPIDRILAEPPLITAEHFRFLEQVARRYCVSLGEILGLAIPDYMPRAAATLSNSKRTTSVSTKAERKQTPGEIRTVSLTAARSSMVRGRLLPDWVQVAIQKSVDTLARDKSVMICVPEQSDIELLQQGFSLLSPEVRVVAQQKGETRSHRYLRFRAMNQAGAIVSLVTRGGILWEQENLGLVLVHDDLDDSFREPGTPFYSVWEVALLRASEQVSVQFLSPYRSAQLQRLVRIGFLNSRGSEAAIRNIEFSEPQELSQKSVIPFLKRNLSKGTVLVLTTRKGSHVGLNCKGCGQRRNCDKCHAPYWVNQLGQIECRLCKQPPTTGCNECGSREMQPGKLGSTRIAADLGRALPGVRIVEANADSPVSVTSKPNQIVVATSGAAPYLSDGYSGLLIFDAMAWHNSSHPNAELTSHRDWLGAVELLQPDAEIYLRNIDADLARRFVLGKFITAADDAVTEALAHNLYPASKYLRIEVDSQLTEEVCAIISEGGAEILKVLSGDRVTVIGRLAASKTLSLVDSLRPWARLQKPSRTNPKRRPVTIELDYEAWR